MSPRVTILITTMSRRDFLERTLWHIYETSSDAEREIVIWDNASTDDTPDFLGTLVGWPGIRVVRSRVNIGATNPKIRMLGAVRTPYLFTLDDDVWMLNRGWVSAVERVLDADISIGQLAIGPDYDEANDFGVAHERLSRPFLRMSPRLPGPRADASRAEVPAGATRQEIAGEVVVLPTEGRRMRPFPISGNACGWRIEDVRGVAAVATVTSSDVRAGNAAGDSLADLRAVWGDALQAAGRREALLLGYGMLHPSPGPLWHLGRSEAYWETRCILAGQYYNRSGDEQRGWLVRAREASGWGRPLDDADQALPAQPRGAK